MTTAKPGATTAYDFTAQGLDGQPAPLEAYRGKVLLIVNTASQCGFTPQYAGLEGLWKKYRDRGLIVLGFPCNQFGGQEPGDSAAIANFCSLTYDVSFPMMAKIDVNGPTAHPLYAWLKQEKRGLLGSESVKWNFTKFLVGRDGEVIARYGSTAEPKSLERAIEAAL
jgi:glutathione peroxidase